MKTSITYEEIERRYPLRAALRCRRFAHQLRQSRKAAQ